MPSSVYQVDSIPRKRLKMLDLKRMPVSLPVRGKNSCSTNELIHMYFVDFMGFMSGGPPGTRTRNLRIKSCLDTPTHIANCPSVRLPLGACVLAGASLASQNDSQTGSLWRSRDGPSQHARNLSSVPTGVSRFQVRTYKACQINQIMRYGWCAHSKTLRRYLQKHAK